MLVKSISKKFADGRMGTGIYKQLKGIYRGKSIQIESFGHTGKGITQKQITIDDKVIIKCKNDIGKFDTVI